MRHIERTTMRLAITAIAIAWAAGPAAAETPTPAPGARPSLVASPKGDGSTMMPMRRSTQAEREAAAKRLAARKAAAEAARKAPPAKAGGSDKTSALTSLARMALAQALGTPDLFNVANYANSPLPLRSCSVSAQACYGDFECPGFVTGETCSGPIVPGTGMRKFVDGLPGLCLGAGPHVPNNLGQCIPLASPDKTTYPGSDYYEIAVEDYSQKMHSDLLPTKLRGYRQVNASGAPASHQYLGPLILAQRNVPVRVKFTNKLGFTGNTNTDPLLGPVGDGHLFVPVDTSIPGAGKGNIDGAGAPCNPWDALQEPSCAAYTDNRATLHLHGGNTPWISDGTQHQWTVPAGETSPFKKGLVTRDVPDMPATGPGEMTFYWTNQQSGRLMWYHDHAYGITRLNAYVGEASGYLLYDPAEEAGLQAAAVPGTLAAGDLDHLVPLIIQDKGFVPPAAQLAVEDPTWDVTRYGGEGSLWFPHVYTPNQWPSNPDLSGANPMGRWDWGPWFFPPQSVLTRGNPAGVPCTTMAGQATGGPPMATTCPDVPNPSIVPESFLDTMLVNGTAYPTVTVLPHAYRLLLLNGSQERNINLSFFVADATGMEVPMVAAIPHVGQKRDGIPPAGATAALPAVCAATEPLDPATGLPAGALAGTCWPNAWPMDGRVGGIPDPTFAGPRIVQLGTEGGLLPGPAVIAAQPVDYEQNKRNIVVLNVTSKALFIGPAERADVVVDFSAYAGKTLILYNDSPAPVPAGDPRLDYYTGNADMTSTGGAPSTQPGYGPNTRTVMQIVVAPTAPAQSPAFPVFASPKDAGASTLVATMAGLFATQQGTPVVPESAYSQSFATTLPNTYFTIQSNGATFVSPGDAGPTTVTFGQKAIQELFDADYGRMNATLGVEMPVTNFLTQTTIPFADFDPPTEFIENNKSQIWKITHNGVDTHTIHFHLLNVQIVNRVGWDGAIRPPDANELGWKESVRMHPLEDIFVALKPVRQNLPWALPDMIRPLDVIAPLGSPVGNQPSQFTGVDITNLPIGVTNQLQNFGWEYVWHCHLLGHEENDMLRAEVFVVAPETPSTPTAVGVGTTPTAAQVTLNWTDNSRSAMSFNIQRTGPGGTVVSLGSVAAPATTFVDATALRNVAYTYQVQASKTLTSLAIPATAVPNSYTASSDWSAASAPVLVPPPAGPTIDFVVSTNRTTAATTVARALTNVKAGTLLVAFIAADAPATGTNTTVSSIANTGGALTWTRAVRTNAQRGTSEIWWAYAPAAKATATVTATLSRSAVSSITVVGFTGTGVGAAAIGATRSASGATGASTATLTTTRANSWVFGVGNDWDRAVARTLGAGQTLVNQSLPPNGDTYWVQRTNATTAATGTAVTINDTAPTNDRWNLSLVEIRTP